MHIFLPVEIGWVFTTAAFGRFGKSFACKSTSCATKILYARSNPLSRANNAKEAKNFSTFPDINRLFEV